MLQPPMISRVICIQGSTVGCAHHNSMPDVAVAESADSRKPRTVCMPDEARDGENVALK